MLAHKAGVTFNRIIYKGAGPMLTDLLPGHVQAGVFTWTSVEPYVREGKLRVLALFDEKRSDRTPDIPVTGEHGLTGSTASANYNLYGPAGLPAAVLSSLEDALANIARDPDYQTAIGKMGYEPRFMTSEQVAALLKSEEERWTAILQSESRP